MSAYKKIETEFLDRDCLIAALKMMTTRAGQLTGERIEVHDEPVNLYGYRGDKRADKANIVIRRGYVGSASNDIGFIQEDGKYRAIISDFDRGYHNTAWVDKLSQEYAVAYATRNAAMNGYMVERQEQPNGEVRLLLTSY